MNWPANLPVSVTADCRSGLIVVRPRGYHAITGQGHLRLSAPIRRRMQLHAGDRLFLAAMRDRDVIVMYTLPVAGSVLQAYSDALTAQPIS